VKGRRNARDFFNGTASDLQAFLTAQGGGTATTPTLCGHN
jgi:hypothetical protein